MRIWLAAGTERKSRSEDFYLKKDETPNQMVKCGLVFDNKTPKQIKHQKALVFFYFPPAGDIILIELYHQQAESRKN